MPNPDTNPPPITSADFRRLEQKIDMLLELFEPKSERVKTDFDALAEREWSNYKNCKPKRDYKAEAAKDLAKYLNRKPKGNNLKPKKP